MSAYTTIRISRAKALQILLERITVVSDKDLEKMLDDILEARLYNVEITHDEYENDDYLL